MIKKYLPYLLIALALISGFIFKDYFDDYYDQKTLKADKKAAQSESNNRIDNRYKTLLIYPKKNRLENFTLVDQTGEPFVNKELKNHWNLIFSGYTNCPDVCPNTLNQMVQLNNLMSKEVRSKFQFIFLSVDPDRDTPEHIKQYLDYFDSSFLGITGKPDQIDILVKGLGGIYSINKQEGEFYTVDHSARIFIVGPNGERYGIVAGDAIKSKDKRQLAVDLTDLAK